MDIEPYTIDGCAITMPGTKWGNVLQAAMPICSPYITTPYISGKGVASNPFPSQGTTQTKTHVEVEFYFHL